MSVEFAIQVILFQLAFLLVYEIWLKKETFFNYNRFYLLITPLLAVLLPFLNIEFLGQTAPAEAFRNIEKTVWLPEVFIGAENIEAANSVTPSETVQPSTTNWWLPAYFSGLSTSLLILGLKLKKLIQLSRKSTITKSEGYKIYNVRNSNIAFTFFNHVFIGDAISDQERDQIMAHELIHVREKHSLDLFIFEILKIVLWFNPLVYLYQNRLATVHEFIADKAAVKTSGKKNYYEQLLNTAFGAQNISFVNQFFSHSLIKKRIIMLQKKNSKTISKFKFLIIIPLMLAMLTYVSCSEEQTEDLNQQEQTLTQKLAELEAFLETKKELTPEEKQQFERLIQKRRELMLPEIEREKEKRKEMTEKYNNLSRVPYAVIERVPAFPGCEDWENDVRKNCTSNKISEFVNKEFDTSLGKELGLTGINRVIVQFRIDETGKVTDIRSRAPHPELEREAERVIASIPQMQPGEHDGKAVSVMYSLPIAFQVQ